MTNEYIFLFLVALTCTVGISSLCAGWLAQNFVYNFDRGQHWDKENTSLCVLLENLALFIGAVCIALCIFTYRFYLYAF